MVSEDREISLLDILLVFKRHVLLIAACASIGLLAGALYALLATPLYTASIVVQPTPSGDENNVLAGLSGRFGSAAALMGINLGSGASEKNGYMAILRSRELAMRFIEQQQLLPALFPERWDLQRKAWVVKEPNMLDKEGGSLSLAPTPWQAYERFRRLWTVEEDPATGIVTISFQLPDPQAAARWANGYVRLANDEIRSTTVEESTRALEYLNGQVEKTMIADLRYKMFDLVEMQLERIALANAREEYAFRIIDRAVVPETRSHPNRTLIVLLATIIGAAIGALSALFKDFYSEPHVQSEGA